MLSTSRRVLRLSKASSSSNSLQQYILCMRASSGGVPGSLAQEHLQLALSIVRFQSVAVMQAGLVHQMLSPNGMLAGWPCPSHAFNLWHAGHHGLQRCTASPGIPQVHEHVDLVLWHGMAFQPGRNVDDLQHLPLSGQPQDTWPCFAESR